MNGNGELIDRIVREVLSQLSSRPETVRTNGSSHPTHEITLTDRVVTADVLSAKVNGSSTVFVGPKAIVTPSAWDFARAAKLTIHRDHNGKQAATTKKGTSKSSDLIVVNSTSAVDRLIADAGMATDNTDCPDVAAEMAADGVRDGKTPVIVFAAWSHRVAMLANRHDKVRAAAIDAASQVRAVAKQMRPNVWCIDPQSLSYFELRNLLTTVEKG